MVMLNVFHVLRRFHLARTHKSFSVDFLGRGHRYLDDLICARRSASVEATISCLVRVERLAETYERSGGSSAIAVELRHLVYLLWQNLEERNTIKLHPRRPKMPAFRSALRSHLCDRPTSAKPTC
jgi:hypothetical protein